MPKYMMRLGHAFDYDGTRYAVFADPEHRLWAQDPDYPGLWCPCFPKTVHYH